MSFKRALNRDEQGGSEEQYLTEQDGFDSFASLAHGQQQLSVQRTTDAAQHQQAATLPPTGPRYAHAWGPAGDPLTHFSHTATSGLGQNTVSNTYGSGHSTWPAQLVSGQDAVSRAIMWPTPPTALGRPPKRTNSSVLSEFAGMEHVQRVIQQQQQQQQLQRQNWQVMKRQYWPKEEEQQHQSQTDHHRVRSDVYLRPSVYSQTHQNDDLGVVKHSDGTRSTQTAIQSYSHMTCAPATAPQSSSSDSHPAPATLASASTPPAASRRDSQTPTPTTSRRRRSARKPRTKVSRNQANSDAAPDYRRSQLERYYPAIRCPPRSLHPARPDSVKGAATATAAAAAGHPLTRPAAQRSQNERSPSRRYNGNMASGGAKWREEQILIICPGSRTTMAQLGCSELTPPAHRIPTRMFRDGDEWRPYYTFKRTKVVGGEEQEEWVEDVDEDKGAVYPIEGGRIVNMDAFLAFLDHVHGLLTTTYHNTPIMLMASPQWTRPDCEAIAQYIFERTRTPALCMIHSGIATQYGLKWPSMTVVDIGYEKVDVTAIHDGKVVNHMDLGVPGPDRQISGGEVFTRKLMQLLKNKEFSHDMAEQLKKSNICEVLPYAAGEEALMELPKETVVPGAAAASGDSASPELKKAELSRPQTQVDGADDGENGETNGEDDGVLDVASIVTSGQTKEFLAKKEKEKASKGGRKPKDKEADSAPAKPVRLPNSKRTHNTFSFEEIIMEEVIPEPVKAPEAKPTETTNGASSEGAADAVKTETNGEATALAEGAPSTDAEAPKAAENAEAPKPADEDKPMENAAAAEATAKPAEETSAPASDAKPTPEHRPKRVKRDVEVGLERFTFAERVEIDRIVTTIFRTIQGIDDMYMRPACWENLVFVGNGARLRGLKENIMQTLSARHLVSPSTATMFTSELPSNVATPTGTGSQTPTGSYTGAPHQLSSSGVNPLLQAATTASAAGAGGNAATPQAPGSEAAGPTQHHHFHSQTPTNIRTVTFPGYLAEWTKNGFEEAMFLGAQVAARITFCLHSNMDVQAVEAQRQSSLSRVDYNELGPKGIRTHSMLS